MECWKAVVGHEGLYEVSDLGRVRRGGRIIKPLARRHGYLAVFLYDGHGNAKQESVHRIVAKAFIPNPNNYEEVNHIDEDKTNNEAKNLEWCSHKQNSNYGTRPERIGLAHKNGVASIRVAQCTKDGTIVTVYPSMSEAERQGFSAPAICLCCKGKQTTHKGYIWRYASEDISDREAAI